MYEMTITKDYGNKKSITVQADGKDKLHAMFKGLAIAAKMDRYNFKHVRHWEVTFTNVRKIA